MYKGPFPLRAWKRAFFLSFIDLRLKRAVKIEASKKISIKQTKNAFFHARSGNGPLVDSAILEYSGIIIYIESESNFAIPE